MLELLFGLQIGSLLFGARKLLFIQFDEVLLASVLEVFCGAKQ